MKSVKDFFFFKRNQFTYTTHARTYTFGSDGVGLVTIDKRLIKIDMPIIHLGGTNEQKEKQQQREDQIPIRCCVARTLT